MGKSTSPFFLPLSATQALAIPSDPGRVVLLFQDSDQQASVVDSRKGTLVLYHAQEDRVEVIGDRGSIKNCAWLGTLLI